MNTRVPLPPLGNVQGSQSGLKSRYPWKKALFQQQKFCSHHERDGGCGRKHQNTKDKKKIKKKMGENNKFLVSIL
jgi:hypothetical protein